MMSKRRIRAARLILVLTILALFSSYPVQAEGVQTEIISNFEVFDADIRDVFRSLAELGGINILMDPQVRGEVSIKLKHGLAIKETIELLSQTYGYSFRWITQTRTVIIGNEKTFSNFESRETKIYHLNYAAPEQVKNALKIIITEDKIGVDPRTNQLTIRASVLEHQNIEEIIGRLDREMPQLNIEARIEEITKSASEELGILWSFNSTTSTNFKITADATIKALEERNQARLLANPNISVTDSQEGKILIGEKFPVITSSQTDSGTTYTVSYIETGTKLTVTPRINEDDIITVSLKAEVSSITEWRTSGDGGNVPVIRTREASSVVRLREGETFVLSGLYQTDNTTGESGLPGLTRIPLIGRLFGSKNKNDSESQVVIFLTPKIIRFNETGEQAKVQTIGKQPPPALPENPAPQNATETVAPAPLIATPTVQEGTDNQNAGSTGWQGSTPENAANELTVTADNLKPETAKPPLPVEPAAEEIPVEAKELPDLAQLSNSANSPLGEATATVSIPQPGKPVDGVGVRLRIKVKKGETISGLARKYGIDQGTVLAENKLTGTETIAVGTELVLPIPQSHFYELKPKETLWRVAKRYGTTVELLMEINEIKDHTKLETGQAIMLPVPVDKIADSRF